MADFITRYLAEFYEEIKPLDFYRSIFPIGELETAGRQEQGKYNAIAVELLPKEENKTNARRYIITDDLKQIEALQSSENFIIISPISYIGRSRQSANARNIYALAVDLDGITEEHFLTDLFFQMENEYLPKPSYIVSSGTGIHLYYQFERPIPCFKNIVKQLSNFKTALTKKIWNKYTTALYDKPQIESLFQGFRMVGGITKTGSRTKAFLTGGKVSMEYLNSFVAERYRVKEFVYKSNLTKEQAKEKFPDWYESRIEKKQRRGNWTCNRAVFDWWVSRIKNEAEVGHRYFCIMILAIYGKKCGIDREELERTAFELVKPFDLLTQDEKNRFTREDVFNALEMYNDNYITFPIDSITELTDIPIEKNKRNFRKQELHLKLARANKAVLKEAGEMRKEGRPDKRQAVEDWRKAHPAGTKAECMRETGISKPTILKYWT